MGIILVLIETAFLLKPIHFRESAHLLGENFAFESVSSEIQQLLSKVTL